jgi:hypothetical protein
MKTARILLAWLLATLFTACGGGGEMVARIGSGGSGAPIDVGVGAVGGFGSVVINGRHYDETGAQIAIDERPDQSTPASVGAVRLGVRMQFESVSNRMTRATVAAEVIGPVTSVSADSFVVLGQTVRVNADPAAPTIYDGFTALPDLAGVTVEVHGQRDASAEIQATRIQLRESTGVLRVVGTVADFANGAFRIGSLTIHAGQAATVPGGQSVANGQRVAVWTDQPLVGNELVARVIRIGGTAIPDNAALTVEGLVTDFLTLSRLRIDGIAVDAGSAQYTGGVASDLRNGRSVRASGTYSGNVLRAANIEFLSMATARVELKGAVTNFVDASGTFRVRDTVTRVTSQTTYLRGDASNLGDGVLVRVEGPVVNGVIEAATFEFLPPSAAIASVIFGTVADPILTAADKTTMFRLSPLPFDVKTTTVTRFKKGTVEDIKAGAGVKVDGTYDGLAFIAEEVQFKNNPSDPPTFAIDGIAGNVQPGSLVVDGKTVNLTSATVYTPAQNALKNGITVAIEAVKINGQLYANSVEIKDQAGGLVSVRGIVSERENDTAAEFLVGSQRVSVAASPQVIPGSKTLKDIKNGNDLEVEGKIANGLLSATKVKFR